MKQFAALYQLLDQTTSLNEKRAALLSYFRSTPAHDAAWALYLLAGGKITGPRRKIASTQELRAWVAIPSHTPPWLVDASYDQVGDLAETLALLLPEPTQSAPDRTLAAWIEDILVPLANRDEAERRAVIVAAWLSLPFPQRLTFNKLLTGALRIGVSQRLVQQALAELSGIPIARIAQRMLGSWTPSPDYLQKLLSAEQQPGDRKQPYPFFLASPLASEVTELGPIQDWLIEWKWDGIRVQLIRRDGEVALWSRGEERLDGRFPEVEQAAADLTVDAVLDGELLAWDQTKNAPMPFSALQNRIQRLKPSAKWLAEIPVRLLAYDLLEIEGRDIRQLPQQQRRHHLQTLLESRLDTRIDISACIRAGDWNEAAKLRAQSRARGVEGLMLKRGSAPYQDGRKRGDWWKWKIAPLTIDAVLLYAQAGHGRRSTLYSDYTFGLWDGDKLVPIAKAYSGLDDKELLALDRWLRAHTLERFGPVRSVEAVQVFELGFEGVNISKRHKSGVALRFPRILRWRHDKPAAEADHLESLKALAR